MIRLLPPLHWLVVAALACATAIPAVAATYKWVDDKGVVHYTDKMPAEAVEKGNVELNKQGIPVRRTEPAPTLEQRRAKQAEDDRLRATAHDREAVDRRDRALMQSYTSEDEIDLARNRALATLDTQITSAEAFSAQLVKRRQELDAKRKTFGDKPVPAAIENELDGIATELTKQDAFIGERKRDSAAVSARYEHDKVRWRELRVMADAKEASATAANASGNAATSRPAPAGTFLSPRAK